MFSGLSNQVSSWMGKKGGEGQEVPSEGLDNPVSEVDVDSEKKDSQGNSKLEMLAGVKSQMTGWLSGGIPGLNRSGTAPTEGADAEAGATDTSNVADQPEKIRDDDASSATGGADSGPGSPTATPTEDKQFGAVSTKALAGAKNLGGFLYNAASKAGKSVVEGGVKIKKIVGENRLIADLNKEQEAFSSGKSGQYSSALPWEGFSNEDEVKEECLTLSTDRRNFVRAPPPGVDFAWDFEANQAVAEAILKADPNLENMRFELVPKTISEENFWRNYFYRISLIRQSHEATEIANKALDDSNQSNEA